MTPALQRAHAAARLKAFCEYLAPYPRNSRDRTVVLRAWANAKRRVP